MPRLATAWEANADQTAVHVHARPEGHVRRRLARDERRTSSSRGSGCQDLQGSASYLDGRHGDRSTPPTQAPSSVTFAAPNSAFLPMSTPATSASSTARSPRRNGADARRRRPTRAEQWFLANSAGSGPFAARVVHRRATSSCSSRNDNYWGPNEPAFPRGHHASRAEGRRRPSASSCEQGDVDIAMQISLDSVGQASTASSVTVEEVASFNFVYLALSPGAMGGEDLKTPSAQGDPAGARLRRPRSTSPSAATASRRRRRSRTASPAPRACRSPKQDLDERQAAARRSRRRPISRSTPRTRRSTSTASTSALTMQKVQTDLEGDRHRRSTSTPVEFSGVGRQDRHATASR